jgi:hypothetical protein
LSNAQKKADFIVGVVKNAILDGWTKEQFLSIAESAWDFLSTPGPGQWGPMQDSTVETKTEYVGNPCICKSTLALMARPDCPIHGVEASTLNTKTEQRGMHPNCVPPCPICDE